jgi:hypothetical protein
MRVTDLLVVDRPRWDIVGRSDDDELFREWARGLSRVEFVPTSSAALLFRSELEDCRPGPNQIAGLVRIVDMRLPDGTPDPGFAPGWMVEPIAADWPNEDWAFTRLPGLQPLYFDRNLAWRGVMRFVIDRVAPAYAIFSIEPE